MLELIVLALSSDMGENFGIQMKNVKTLDPICESLLSGFDLFLWPSFSKEHLTESHCLSKLLEIKNDLKLCLL